MTIAIRIPHYHITHRKWGVWAATLPWVCLVTLSGGGDHECWCASSQSGRQGTRQIPFAAAAVALERPR